ncbi:Hpt domain-containing protein [Chitinibacter fontanus]|uniref:Hpt domain-containing protein n=1 Tax=Chitinibacter fontanus TaxID=1737446 RepID=A0A7D5VD20_9NEIS|nr:Hpt domain-containing protein [Chitinibacter fontanus]QLI83093.1 Hpt domain-containing protein [Chitinibacter fontanus]
MDGDLAAVVQQELIDIETMFNELKNAVGMDMRDELLALFYPTLDECLLGLDESVATLDKEQIISFAHKLKGAAGQLGATQISLSSKNIEQSAKKDEFASMSSQLTQLKVLATAVRASLISA